MTATTPRPQVLSPLARGPAVASRHLGDPLGDRVRGVDLARALAIIGMIAVHVGPTGADGVVGRLYAIPHGRASLLFMVVAGVGVSLLARSRSTTLASARVTLLWRAVLLLPAGLALQQLDHGVNVILQAYAVLFVIAAIVLTLRDRTLLVLAAVAAAIGPVIFWFGQSRAPDVFDRSGEVGGSVGEVAHGLLLSGPYPVVTWVGPLLFGIWLGRRDLTDERLQRRLVVIGTTVGVVSVAIAEVVTRLAGVGAAVGAGAGAGAGVDSPANAWRLAVATPHSQMPLWLLGSTATAAAVLGASLWAAPRWRRTVRPLVLTGQLALTVYVGHLVVLHLAADTLRTDLVGEAAVTVLVSSLVAMVFATLWRARFARGPLETALRPPHRWRGPVHGPVAPRARL